METVVVGLDTAGLDPAPLQWAVDYCGITDAALVGVVGHVAEQAEVPPEWYEDERAELRAQATKTVDAAAPAVDHRVDVRDGDPREELLEAAEDFEADLVVVGVHGSGGFHHLGLGSVAHHLSRHLRVPLVVVPGTSDPIENRPVIVGLDGSPGDVATLEWSLKLARAAGGSVCAVYASDPWAMSYPHPDGATVSDQARDRVKAHVAGLAASGAEIEMIVDVDDPVDALTRVADAREAAVVVVGRKGVGHLRGLLVGRVPSALPFTSHRPVAIVPRAVA